MSKQRTKAAIEAIFEKYDADKTGFMNQDKLKECIFSLNGQWLDEVEIGHICKVMKMDEDGNVCLSDFSETMMRFFKFC